MFYRIQKYCIFDQSGALDLQKVFFFSFVNSLYKILHRTALLRQPMKAAKTVHLGQDIWDRASRTGQPGQEAGEERRDGNSGRTP
jgi:hypothetical protein